MWTTYYFIFQVAHTGYADSLDLLGAWLSDDFRHLQKDAAKLAI